MTIIDAAFARDLAAALAIGPNQLIALLNAQFTSLPGIRTVTWLATAPDLSVTHRIGTSDAKDFPIGGSDPISEDDPWCRRIFGSKRAVIGNTPVEMAAFIPETDDLIAMGYGATMCSPIVIAGEVRGTVNILGDAGCLTMTVQEGVATLLPLAALVFTYPGISDRHEADQKSKPI